MSEEWRAIPGFEGFYEVSDLGRVRSLDRIVRCYGPKKGAYVRALKGGLMRLQNHSGGYLQVALAGKLQLVQWLVATAFIGPRPEGLIVCHNDGDKKNNRKENVRYDTPAENTQDLKAHGTACLGERNGCAKITHKDVESIRRRYEKGELQREIAEDYGVKQTQISRIVRKTRWAHVV